MANIYQGRGSGAPQQPHQHGGSGGGPYPSAENWQYGYKNIPVHGMMGQQPPQQQQQQLEPHHHAPRLYAQQQKYGGTHHSSVTSHYAQQQRDKEREKRRQVMAEALQAEQERSEAPEDFFEAPKKITEPATPGPLNADRVLGDYNNAFSMITTCVGVDYQPPTPAPAHNHDDEDDGEQQRPVRKAPAIVKPPPNNTRLPANMDNPRPTNHRPPRPQATQAPPAPPVWGSSSMAPPISHNSHKIGSSGGVMGRPSLPPPQPQARGTPPAPSFSISGGYSTTAAAALGSSPQLSTNRLLLNRNKAQSNLSLNVEVPDHQVDQIIKEVLGKDVSCLPSTPLSGIITPRVENSEDRGVQQHKPRYQGGMFGNPAHFLFGQPDHHLISHQPGTRVEDPPGSGFRYQNAQPPPPTSSLTLASKVLRLSESDSDKELLPAETVESLAAADPRTIVPELAPLLSPPPPTPLHHKRSISPIADLTTPLASSGAKSAAAAASDRDSSNSGSDSSNSGESSESEDEESDDEAKKFSLDTFIQQEAKLSPMPCGGVSSGMSAYTADPSPRGGGRGGYPPTPSPLGGGSGGSLPNNHQNLHPSGNSPGLLPLLEPLDSSPPPLHRQAASGQHSSQHHRDLDKHLDYVKTIPPAIEPLGGSEDSDDCDEVSGDRKLIQAAAAGAKKRSHGAKQQKSAMLPIPLAKRPRQSRQSESRPPPSPLLSPSSDEGDASVTVCSNDRSKPPRKRKRPQIQQGSSPHQSDTNRTSHPRKKKSVTKEPARSSSSTSSSDDDSYEEPNVKISARRPSKTANPLQAPASRRQSASASPVKAAVVKNSLHHRNNHPQQKHNHRQSNSSRDSPPQATPPSQHRGGGSHSSRSTSSNAADVRVNSRQQQQSLLLSESDGDDYPPSGGTSNQNHPESSSSGGGNQKGLALRAMFGMKAAKAGGGKGGKGGKGPAGKGGINVIVKEDRGSDDDDQDSDREMSNRSSVRRPIGQSPLQQKSSVVLAAAKSPATLQQRHPSPAADLEMPLKGSSTSSRVVNAWALAPAQLPPQQATADNKTTHSTAMSPSSWSRCRHGAAGAVLTSPATKSALQSDFESSSERSTTDTTIAVDSLQQRRRDRVRHDRKHHLPNDWPEGGTCSVATKDSGVGLLRTSATPACASGRSPLVSPSLTVASQVTYRPDGRPILLFSLPLSRINRSGANMVNRASTSSGRAQTKGGRDKKTNGGKELWLTRDSSSSAAAVKLTASTTVSESGDERPRSVNKNNERLAASPLPPQAAPISERPQSSNGWSVANRDSRGYNKSSHRKQVNRTLTPLSPLEALGKGDGSVGNDGDESFLFESPDDLATNGRSGGGYESDVCDRKRSLGDSNSPSGSKKRLRLEDEEEKDDEDGGDAVMRRRRVELFSSAAHPTFLPVGDFGSTGGLMPPPASTVPVYYSYFESRRHHEELEVEENVEEEAKKLKHEADHEENMEVKCTKYLQAFMMFSLSGLKSEKFGDKTNAFNMYNQTLLFIKYVMKPFISRKSGWQPKEKTDIRLVVMSLRAQSLLNLKMYKLKKHELKENQRCISDALAKSNQTDKEEDKAQAEQPHLSPTPSPAGSEGSNCSKSSGYTSSGEGRQQGVLTPPTATLVCLSIPKTVVQNQYNLASYLSQCHELWEQADLFVDKFQCENFFIKLDRECGTLTLHSTLKDLVQYTRKGLDYISQEFQASQQRSGVSAR